LIGLQKLSLLQSAGFTFTMPLILLVFRRNSERILHH